MFYVKSCSPFNHAGVLAVFDNMTKHIKLMVTLTIIRSRVKGIFHKTQNIILYGGKLTIMFMPLFIRVNVFLLAS